MTIGEDPIQAVDVPTDDFTLPEDDPLYSQFQQIVSRFDKIANKDAQPEEKAEVFYDDDNDEIPEDEEEGPRKMSKKARKALNSLTVAELKALVRRPELVEWTDVDAPDPRLQIGRAHV